MQTLVKNEQRNISSLAKMQSQCHRSPSHEEIAETAYDLWVMASNRDGFDVQHWLEAERILSSRRTDLKSN